MSKKTPDNLAAPRLLRRHAPIFSALGNPTRLALVAQLSTRAPSSISRLARGASITRQAITRHLRVLEQAGLVRGETAGRECLFQLNPAPLQQGRDYLERVSQQWDEALTRLRALVETPY